ncbi:MAG: uncharacterized protein QOG94_3726 [Solirubrobacteraceae bacterium]|jgi:uncharacterized protein YciI|nr:uncharacterized protein [Solirubrobacteraceae bacterium]
MSDPGHLVLFYDYVPYVVQRRVPYRAAHLAHARGYKEQGTLLMAGALGDPPTRAMFVFLGDDPSLIEGFVTSDPYVQNGIVTGHRVLPWNVVI